MYTWLFLKEAQAQHKKEDYYANSRVILPSHIAREHNYVLLFFFLQIHWQENLQKIIKI